MLSNKDLLYVLLSLSLSLSLSLFPDKWSFVYTETPYIIISAPTFKAPRIDVIFSHARMRMQKYRIILHVPLKYEYHLYVDIEIEEYHEMKIIPLRFFHFT